MNRREKRRSPRFPFEVVVQVLWVDQQGHHRSNGRCIEVSETGIRLELPAKVGTNCIVTVKSQEYGLNTSAQVRHVVQRGLKYHVGLEFCGGWKWKTPGQKHTGVVHN